MGYKKETISKPLEQPAFADSKHDNAIVEVSGFFCHACVMDKPATEASPDPRYCQGCYDFLTKEAELLDGRKPAWVPKDSQCITRTPLEPSRKPLQPASGVGHNYIDTQIGSGIMSTVESKKDDGKRGPKQKALPRELIKQWAGEGMGSRVIALKLNSELGIKVSYRTIQRVLSGERLITGETSTLTLG
ncbi:hypothetical protein ES703_112865 [subsurface metagenome]